MKNRITTIVAASLLALEGTASAQTPSQPSFQGWYNGVKTGTVRPPAMPSTAPAGQFRRSGCVFRPMPATHSGACRPGIPVHAGHPFRCMPAGVSEAG